MTALRLGETGQESLDVFADHIGFDIDMLSLIFKSNRGPLGGVRYNADGETLPVTTVNRQTGAVHGNRALGNHVARQRLGGLNGDDDGIADRLPPLDRSNAVDMAGNQVTVNAVRKAHGSFQIDTIADTRITESRRFKCFRRDIHFKAPAVYFDGSQTGTADSNAVADFCMIQRKIRFNRDALSLGRGAHGMNPAETFYNSCKHKIRRWLGSLESFRQLDLSHINLRPKDNNESGIDNRQHPASRYNLQS